MKKEYNDNHTKWAKRNRKLIARAMIAKYLEENETLEKDSYPVGIFTAGLPGAGKTEFTKWLSSELSDNPLRIDFDELATYVEGYKPKIANRFRPAASSILGKVYEESIKKKVNFIFDGTFAHKRALENIDRALKRGYKIKLYYVHQDPVIAWKFTKDRELVEHRSIDKEGFIESYYNVYKNMNILQNSYKSVTISLVLKDDKNRVGQIHEDIDSLYDLVGQPFDREHLIELLLEE